MVAILCMFSLKSDNLKFLAVPAQNASVLRGVLPASSLNQLRVSGYEYWELKYVVFVSLFKLLGLSPWVFRNHVLFCVFPQLSLVGCNDDVR